MVQYVAAFACIMSADAPCLQRDYCVVVMAAVTHEPWPDIRGAGADISAAHRPLWVDWVLLGSGKLDKGRILSSCLQLVGKRTLPLLA